jgi:cell division cycle 2-like
MIAKRAAAICLALGWDDGDETANSCKRQRLWSTEDYEATRSLGGGSFGDVFEARHRVTGEAVAVKALRASPSPAPKTNDTAAAQMLKEAGFLAACRRHPSLVDLHALAVNPNTGEVALVMERLGPSLHDVLYGVRHRDGLPSPVPEVRRIMRQLLNGAKHMHSRRIMHRDIKLSNILVDDVSANSAGGPVSVKICDFGLAASMSDQQPPYEKVDTRRYMAPEVLLGNRDYDAMVDMWSLGCVMAELLTGTPLFNGAKDDSEQIVKIFKVLGVPGPRTWPAFKTLPLAGTVDVPRVRRFNRLRKIFPRARTSEEGFDVLKRLLSYNIAKRLSATAALRSPWFANDVDSLASVSSPTETKIVS